MTGSEIAGIVFGFLAIEATVLLQWNGLEKAVATVTEKVSGIEKRTERVESVVFPVPVLMKTGR